ncbi:MAG: hypothetical protein R2729_02545 [Bryobacteraceae bacterium]
MRTTVEFPDNLMVRAKAQAAAAGISLREFLIQSVEAQLAQPAKVRRPPPMVGHAGAPQVAVLTRAQIDEASY